MRERYEHLDGLRGIAALTVMLCHGICAFGFGSICAETPLTGSGSSHLDTWALPLLLPIAGSNFSVCIFLVLSGFVLAHVFLHSQLGVPALVLKRAVRLGLPILAVTMFSWALLAGSLNYNHLVAPLSKSSWLDEQMQQSPNIIQALRDGVYGNLIGPVKTTTSYDGVLWTMPIEFTGSLLIITLFAVGKQFSRLGATRRLGGFALIIIGVLCFPLYLSLIIFGAAIYLLELRRNLERNLASPIVLMALLFLSLFLGVIPHNAARGYWLGKLVSLAPVGIFDVAGWSKLPGSMAMDAVISWHALGAVLLLIVLEAWPVARDSLVGHCQAFLDAYRFRFTSCICRF